MTVSAVTVLFVADPLEASYFGEGEMPATAEWEEMSGGGDFFCCKVYAKAKVPSATSTGETSVPYRWLDLYSNSTALYANCLTNYYYGAYNALGEHVAANGVRVEESFARGLDPDNAAETNLLATISFDADGKPVSVSRRRTPRSGITPSSARATCGIGPFALTRISSSR